MPKSWNLLPSRILQLPGISSENIEFPEGAIIGGVIREEGGLIANGNTEIKAGDHVVVFTLPSAVSMVGKYFS